MGIESLYSDGIEAGIQRELANPARETPPSFRVGSFLSSGVKGVPAAGLEVGGSAMDLLSTSAVEVARRPRLKVLENQPDDSERVQATAKFVAEGGMVMRGKAEEFAPDPATTHIADQVLYGITRLGAKVVAATAVGNLPTAGALLLTEEGNTAYRKLRDKGIDHETALKAAAVEGAGAAAAVIPMAGQTIKGTLGLMGVAGPGTFMAQEALSKKILEQAGYHNEASRHDPLDPLGLSLSVALPAIFGGAHIAGLARRARPEPIGPIRTEKDVAEAVQLTPEEQKVSDAFERSAGNLKELRDAVAAEKNPDNKALLQAELDKQTAAAAAHIEKSVIERSGVDPEAVDAARTRVTSDALYRHMPDDLEAPAAVLRAGDSIAAGEWPNVKAYDFSDMVPKYEVPPASQATLRMTDSGFPDIRTEGIRLTDAHPVERFEAILDQGEQIVRFAIRTPDGKKMGYTDLMLKDGQVVSLYDIETTQGLRGQGIGSKVVEAITSLDPDRKLDISNIVDDAVPFWEKVGVQVNDGNRSPTLDWHQFAESPAGRSRGAPRRGAELAGESPRFDAGAVEGNGRPPQAEARELSPEEAELFGFGSRVDANNALPEPHQVELKVEALAKSDRDFTPQRVKQIETENPDMKVQLPGSEETLTVAQAMERAKAEHAEEVSENKLLQAAFECALSFGA